MLQYSYYTKRSSTPIKKTNTKSKLNIETQRKMDSIAIEDTKEKDLENIKILYFNKN